MQGILDVTGNALVGAAVKAVGSPNTQVPLTATVLGDLCIAQGFPERTELVRQGNSWGCNHATTATFLNIAKPTTGFAIAIMNNDPTKAIIIDNVSYTDLTAVSAAAQAVNILVANVPPSVPANVFATGTLIAANTIYSLSNKANYNGAAALFAVGTVTAAPVITGVAWRSVGGSLALAASAAGFGQEAFLYGRYIVRPGGVFLMNVAAGAATGTFNPGIEWHEVALPLG